jgi:hypothetical protein
VHVADRWTQLLLRVLDGGVTVCRVQVLDGASWLGPAALDSLAGLDSAHGERGVLT